MRQDRVTGVTGPGGPGSGYLIAPGLVLTSAHVVGHHVVGHHGAAVEVFLPGRPGTVAGRVVWCGAAGGKDDAALIELDDPEWAGVQDTIRWGRTVTERPGLHCQCWGMPEVVQRADRATELLQVSGGLNPGSYAVGDRYLLDVDAGPDARTDGSSPWGGMCGTALFSEGLLIGVVAADPGGWGHRALEAVPAYVLYHDPAFRDLLRGHGEALLGLDPVELRAVTDEQARSPLSETVPTPAGLLPTRRAVVPFHGRKDQLDDLHTWAQAPRVGVWLLHGSGGQGKTRLAHEFGHRLAAQGWAVVWLHPDATGAQLDVLAEVVRPLLIVVDYAETRPEQLQTLLTVVATRQTATPAKVLLLARTVGSWWGQVAAHGTDPVRDLVETARVAELTVLDHAPTGQQQAYQTAVEAFGAMLPRVPDLGTIDWAALTEHTRHRPLPAGFGVQTALAVQMTALADLLDAAQPGGTTDADRRRGPEDRMLDHERGY